jgi:hypothetical protein
MPRTFGQQGSTNATPRFCRNLVPDELLQLIRAPLPCKGLDSFMPGCGKPLSQAVVIEEADNVSRQSFGIARRRQERSDFVFGVTMHASDVCGNQCAPAGHRLGGRKVEPLSPTGAEIDTAPIVNAVDKFCLGRIPEVFDPLRDGFRPLRRSEERDSEIRVPILDDA